MATSTIIRNMSVAALGVAGLTLSACATKPSHGSVYDYESGGSSNCGATMCSSTHYGGATSHQSYESYPSATYTSDTTYSSGATTDYYGSSASSYGTSYGASSSMGVECPAGTTLQGDNTCLQSGSSSYSHSTTTSYPTTTTTTSTGYYEPSTTTCPAGTYMGSDGSCMQSMTTSGYTSSGTTYSSSDYLPVRK